MDSREAERRAASLHAGGFNCAESVLTAVLEQAGLAGNEVVPKIATCFGGGIGRTHEDVCGALVGGLMAVGCLLGRTEQGADWDRAAQTAVEIRDRFSEPFPSSRCGDIRTAFGSDEAEVRARCHQLSGTTAALVCEVISRR